MLRVAVVYHVLPHYRSAVARSMDSSVRLEYTFFANPKSYQGIKSLEPNSVKRFIKSPFRFFGPIMWQNAAVKVAFQEYDALVYLADSHFISTWVGAALARLRGKSVLFWAHGWLKPERSLKRVFRYLFYKLATKLLVYGERSKSLGVRTGYPASRITVIYNSLDVERADKIIKRIEDGSLNTINPRGLFAHTEFPLIVCTARITRICRFDLLIQAASILARQGMGLNILLIGDGPETGNLKDLADELDVPVEFFGACYNEDVLGQIIYKADLTVSPGKIGLTAMHTLMYGTPAITHSALNDQMPEVEALEENVTGGLFRQGDAESLASTIRDWLASGYDRTAIRIACRAVIQEKWNPQTQARLIENAVLEAIESEKVGE